MNKEEITYKIPNNQIHISEIKDEDCLIWISPKALYMANTIDKLQQENQKYKEVIDRAIDYINKYAWQEDIIGGIYTTTGKPATDRYMKLEWDNCNELLDILRGMK